MKTFFRFGYRKQLLLFFVSLFFTFSVAAVAQPNPSNPQELVEQGKAFYEAGEFSKAIDSLEEAASLWQEESRWQPLAITLTNLGRVQLASGKSETAVDTWENAIALYRDHAENDPAISRLQRYLAYAFQELGLYNQACESLTQSLQVSSQLCGEQGLATQDLTVSASTDPLQISAWQALAEVFRQTGRLEESQQILSRLQKLSLPYSEQDRIALSLGNTYKALADQRRDRAAPIQFKTLPWRCQPIDIPDSAQQNYQNALKQYQQATQSKVASVRSKAQLNGLTLLAETGQGINNSFSQEIDLDSFPFGPTRIYAHIKAAKTQACLSQNQNQSPNWSVLENQIQRAIALSHKLEDTHAASYAVGNLGSLYEYQGWWWKQNGSSEKAREKQLKALEISDRALFLAQSVQAKNSFYQWHWQRGRLLKALGRETEAITAYQDTVNALETVREDLVSIDSDIQLSFRNQVEPVYREFVELLLDSLDHESSPEKVQEILTQSLYYVESLQLVELENFLQCNLETLEEISLSGITHHPNPPEALRDQIEDIFQNDPQNAFIYPIFLENQIAVILKQPREPFRYHITPVESQKFEKILTTLQTYLGTDPSRRNDIRDLSSEIYQWLIKPFEKELETAQLREKSEVKRLTFILDGALRNIPMSVLFDAEKERYLLERYAIAIAPSLQLLDSQKPSTELSALITGLSEARQVRGRSFSALNNVPEELAAISSVIPSEQLLNDTFVRSNINQQLENNAYSVLHAATHGNFSSDPHQTFLLLYNELLQVQELNTLLDNQSTRLELLVLSACETATGDRRAALGVAGMALRAGAKSALATLWQVNDESTATLMSEFYRELIDNPSLPKAEALRNAQLKLWENSSREWQLPFFWSPYVILGNWL